MILWQKCNTNDIFGFEKAQKCDSVESRQVVQGVLEICAIDIKKIVY